MPALGQVRHSIAMRIDDGEAGGHALHAVLRGRLRELAVAGTSQLVEGLDDNTTYYFRVRAEG
jgi:hypothetical protein